MWRLLSLVFVVRLGVSVRAIVSGCVFVVFLGVSLGVVVGVIVECELGCFWGGGWGCLFGESFVLF